MQQSAPEAWQGDGVLAMDARVERGCAPGQASGTSDSGRDERPLAAGAGAGSGRPWSSEEAAYGGAPAAVLLADKRRGALWRRSSSPPTTTRCSARCRPSRWRRSGRSHRSEAAQQREFSLRVLACGAVAAGGCVPRRGRPFLRSLATSLLSWRDTYRFILTADAYRAHPSASAWRAASRAGVGYAILPASMAWLVRPRDTHEFAACQRALSQEFQCRLLAASADSDRWVPLVSSMVASWTRVVRDASWAARFRSNGISPNPGHPSPRALAVLGGGARRRRKRKPSRTSPTCLAYSLGAPTSLWLRSSVYCASRSIPSHSVGA